MLITESDQNFIKLLKFESIKKRRQLNSADIGYSSLQREAVRGVKRFYRMPKVFFTQVQEVTPDTQKEIMQMSKQTDGILRQTVK